MKSLVVMLALLLVTGLGAAVQAPASARDDDRREVRLRGDCSQSAEWKLAAKTRDGGLEVEFEVESIRRARQPWRVTVSQDGTHLFSGVRRARVRGGEFTVEPRGSAPAAVSAITARAQNLRTGEVCLAGVRI